MKSQATPLSLTRIAVVAAVTVVLGLLVIQLTPLAHATGSVATPVASATYASMHDGVDWSRVPAAPVSTGATIGAYD